MIRSKLKRNQDFLMDDIFFSKNILNYFMPAGILVLIFSFRFSIFRAFEAVGFVEYSFTEDYCFLLCCARLLCL